MKHIIDSKDFSREFLTSLFEKTDDIIKNTGKYSESLKGKVIATLFYEPSTRTRLSFESAVLRLGGSVISTENAEEISSVKKGETLEDTIKTIENYAEAIIIRHKDDDAGKTAASISNVPIINAGSGKKHHPTQALLDLYTIQREKEKIDNISILVMGDLRYGRTIHSLLELLSLYQNIKVYGYPIKGLEMDANFKIMLKEKGVHYIEVQSFDDVPASIDIIYQTRIQKERFTQNEEVHEIIINQNIMDKFSEKTLLMHPLPRNNEISNELDRDKRSIYFKQAKNGMFVRMAILHELLNK
jgi:aspartate carbamoyltransferase catalytic subunit